MGALKYGTCFASVLLQTISPSTACMKEPISWTRSGGPWGAPYPPLDPPRPPPLAPYPPPPPLDAPPPPLPPPRNDMLCNEDYLLREITCLPFLLPLRLFSDMMEQLEVLGNFFFFFNQVFSNRNTCMVSSRGPDSYIDLFMVMTIDGTGRGAWVGTLLQACTIYGSGFDALYFRHSACGWLVRIWCWWTWSERP